MGMILQRALPVCVPHACLRAPAHAVPQCQAIYLLILQSRGTLTVSPSNQAFPLHLVRFSTAWLDGRFLLFRFHVSVRFGFIDSLTTLRHLLPIAESAYGGR